MLKKGYAKIEVLLVGKIELAEIGKLLIEIVDLLLVMGGKGRVIRFGNNFDDRIGKRTVLEVADAVVAGFEAWWSAPNK